MGASVWSNDFYADREAERKAKKTDAFEHHRAMATKPMDEQHIHDLMSPKRKKIREARDSAEHPNSLPIATLFDITGSMSNSPRAFQQKLGTLMNRLLSKGYTADPQILIGCIGDSNDRLDARVSTSTDLARSGNSRAGSKSTIASPVVGSPVAVVARTMKATRTRRISSHVMSRRIVSRSAGRRASSSCLATSIRMTSCPVPK